MSKRAAKDGGFTLVEVIITITVLTILTMSILPLAQNAARRQKEQRLRETLATVRAAIDEFKRDSQGICSTANPGQVPLITPDPRSRVMISDCKLFKTENLDRYPPSLDVLVEGVSVKSRSPLNNDTSRADPFDDENTALKKKATDTQVDKKKVYLRQLPVDPITGEKDTWILRSNYQEKDDDSWDEVNVFDIRSGAEGEALNGEKYSDW